MHTYIYKYIYKHMKISKNIKNYMKISEVIIHL